MPSIRCIALLSLPLISSVCSTPIPTANSVQDVDFILSSDQAKAAFHDLFKDVSEESLNAALRDRLYPKYKDGLLEFPETTNDNAHDDPTPFATQLLMSAAVRLELVKRQSNETASVESTAPPAAPTTADEIQPSETQAPPQTSNNERPPETTNAPSSDTSAASPPPQSSPARSSQQPSQQSSQRPSSSAAASTPDPTIAVPVTRVESDGQTITSSVLQPGAVVTTTNAEGSEVVVTTPRPTTPTAVTRTGEDGSTYVTTITPSAGRITSAVTRTTTNAQGSTVIAVETQVIEVSGATPEEGNAADQGGDGTQTGEPSLQSEGAGLNWGVDRAMLMGGAMGVAAMLI